MTSQPSPYFLKAIEEEVDFTAVRSRGPGGQNVNKVSSAAQMTWNFEETSLLSFHQKYLIRLKLGNHINSESQLYLRSDEYRDLPQNKARCIEKLLGLLAGAFHKDKPRKASKPTRSSKIKKKETKNHRGDLKKSRKRIVE